MSPDRRRNFGMIGLLESCSLHGRFHHSGCAIPRNPKSLPGSDISTSPALSSGSTVSSKANWWCRYQDGCLAREAKTAICQSADGIVSLRSVSLCRTSRTIFWSDSLRYMIGVSTTLPLCTMSGISPTQQVIASFRTNASFLPQIRLPRFGGTRPGQSNWLHSFPSADVHSASTSRPRQANRLPPGSYSL
jgi:hypothetical protein